MHLHERCLKVWLIKRLIWTWLLNAESEFKQRPDELNQTNVAMWQCPTFTLQEVSVTAAQPHAALPPHCASFWHIQSLCPSWIFKNFHDARSASWIQCLLNLIHLTAAFTPRFFLDYWRVSVHSVCFLPACPRRSAVFLKHGAEVSHEL